jgi:phosphoglycolate phosphatase-like HAD superfamily hydrolase
MTPPTDAPTPSFVFDLDGTLVDRVYQHVLAWREALEREGISLAVWRIHRRIGMSGGLLVNALLRETGLPVTRRPPGSGRSTPRPMQGWWGRFGRCRGRASCSIT